MLPKQFRLTQDREISAVLRRGRRKSTNNLSVICAASRYPVPRFGFLVSKKVSNKANQRNLAKRRLRHIVGKRLQDFHPGYDCVLVARPKILQTDYQDLERELLKCLFELGLTDNH